MNRSDVRAAVLTAPIALVLGWSVAAVLDSGLEPYSPLTAPSSSSAVPSSAGPSTLVPPEPVPVVVVQAVEPAAPTTTSATTARTPRPPAAPDVRLAEVPRTPAAEVPVGTEPVVVETPVVEAPTSPEPEPCEHGQPRLSSGQCDIPVWTPTTTPAAPALPEGA